MRVVRKALPLIALVFIIAGCAVTQQFTGADNESDASIESELYTQAPAEVVQEATEAHKLVDISEAGVGLDLERGEGFTRLLVNTSSAEPAFDVMTLNQPPRLVVDLLGEKGSLNSSWDIPNDAYLQRVRLGRHQDKIRVVFDLTDSGADVGTVDHQIDAATGQLKVTFVETAKLLPAAQTAARASLEQPIEEMEEQATELAETPTPELPVTSDETTAELDSAIDQTVDSQIAAQPKQEIEAPRLESIEFTKTRESAGEISLAFTESVAFDLRKTAPSEYALTVPGIVASERTRIPLIAPAGFPGIRTARAVQEEGSVTVRMFVDAGVRLSATPSGNSILVTAANTPTSQTAESPAAEQTGARAQLEDDQIGEVNQAPPAAPVEGGILAADGSRRYTGRLISLDLQDTDIDNALRIIAEVSNLNIIASDDVQGKVTLRLIDVPWDQALDVILKTNGLDQVKEGNVIRIAPVEKLRAEREALREAKRAAEELEDLGVQYIRVSYARVTELQEQVETVLSERGSVTVDERTNQLIIKDIVKGQEDVIELVSRLDLRTPQVLLETQIVESQRNLLRDLGFQWNFQYNAGPATGNATGYNFPNSINVGGAATSLDGSSQIVDFPAASVGAGSGSALGLLFGSADGTKTLGVRISALEQEGIVKVVSRPQVATVNNKPAEIKSVEKIRVRLPDSGLSVATGSGANASGGGSTAFEEIDVGITLRVTPQASPDYYVLLDIEAVSSTLGNNVVDNIPSTIEREATSTILVKSGETFALGGVYRIQDTDRVEGVPFFKDIPFLGHAFRRSLTDKNDEELIFFITPHIVEGSFDPSLM